MDRIVLYQHLIRYLLTASLIFCLYTLITYLGFSIKLNLSTWIYMTLSNSLIWTAYAAHNSQLYICFRHLGWPANRALRAPYIFSVLIISLILLVKVNQQSTTNHHFSISCQTSQDQIELCASRNSPTVSNKSRCQKFNTVSKQFCQQLTNQFSNGLLLPYQQELNKHLNTLTFTKLVSLDFQQTQSNHLSIIIEFFTRLIILKCLTLCLIHVPIPQVFSILMICFTICTELVLSFQ